MTDVQVVEAPSINTDLVIGWVGALQSGEYKKSTGRLRNPGGWCCLGVLADVAIKMGLIDAEWVDVPEDGWSRYSVLWRDGTGEHRASQGLPYGLAELVGLNDYMGAYPVAGESWHLPDPYGLHGQDVPIPQRPLLPFGSLAGANDDGIDFPIIAMAIEARLLRGEDESTVFAATGETQDQTEVNQDGGAA